MSMIKFLVTVLFLFLNAEETLQEHECGVQYQSKLRELLNIKQNCSTALYENCCQIKELVTKSPSGLYQMRYNTVTSHFTSSYVETQCDMETDGGGWLVIQRRLPNGTVNFTRDWSDYENGFGDINGEFWYGLKNIHTLTRQTPVELRIDMVRESDGFKFSWTYQTFIVAGASNKYKLSIEGANGTYGTDAMSYHNGRLFSTYDKDNDRHITINCALNYQAGWWYNSCYFTNLNGPHNTVITSNSAIDTGSARLIWHDGSTNEDLSSAEMKIRPKSCVLSQDSLCN